MNLRETPVEQQIQYEGRIIRLRVDKAQLPNGKIATREVVEHNGGVCIAALTEQQERCLCGSSVTPIRRLLLELPAGKIDKGEEPLACGKRELTRGNRRVGAAVPLARTAVSLAGLLWRGDPPVSGHRAVVRPHEPGRGRISRGGAHPAGKGGADGAGQRGAGCQDAGRRAEDLGAAAQRKSALNPVL